MDSISKERNKKIVKNTLYMYGRMLIMLLLSLFTARIVFNTLGVNNYGIYGLVGGIIAFLTFLNSGLNAATGRYITAEIARGTEKTISHVFYICILAHLLIGFVVFLLAETVGLWIVNNVLNIPDGRMYAANWVYQLSVVSALLGIIQSPFGAVIVAYEKMNIYAYFTILDVLFKLFIIYMVQIIPGDKLIVYALLVFCVGIINILIYRIYTYRKITVCRLNNRTNDKPLLKEIFSFMSWSIAGQAAVVGTNQGVSVLVNIYFNVAVNAAMGVSSAITSTVNGFVSNFQMAFNPQITKSYVNKENDYLQTLMIRASKLSGYLIIVFLIPLVFEAGNVLTIWLGNYPNYAVQFCICTLLAAYVEAISAPLWMMIYAQTNIKQYQVAISSVYSLNFIIGWIVLALGAVPYSVILVRIFVFMALAFIRLIYVKKFFVEFEMKEWTWQVVVKNLFIILLSATVTGFFAYILKLPKFVHVVCVTMISLCITIPLIYKIGLEKNEKKYVLSKVMQRVKKVKEMI